MSLRRQLALLLPWFLVVSFFILLVSSWGLLTGRVAVHFDAYGAPNGWADKKVFALVALASLGGATGAFTWCLHAFRAREDHMVALLYSLYYLTVMFLSLIFWQITRFNLQGSTFSLSLPVWVGLAAGGLGYWVGRSRPEIRSAAAADSAARATEKSIIGIDVHRRPIPIVLMLAGLALMIRIYPGHGSPIALRVLVGAAVAFVGYFTLLACAGFSYVVSRDGVRVRGLFRSMRTVSRKDILAVDIQPAPPFGGYGIRLWGGDTAYYWGGKQTVRLKMAGGNLFLGSNRPEYLLKLLQDMLSKGVDTDQPT